MREYRDAICESEFSSENFPRKVLWSKIGVHFSFQDMTAFSPPVDSWIISYPTKEKSVKKEEKPKSMRVPRENQVDPSCRKYLEGSEIPVKSNKSLGTDDHFKSAVCSKNLLKVCEKLMINKEFVTQPTNDTADDDFEELSLMSETSRSEYFREKHQRTRRDSQSLPASPKMERKSQPESKAVTHNPYFTVTKSEPRTESSLSFLTSLFGITGASKEVATTNLQQKFDHDKREAEKLPQTSEAPKDGNQRRKLTPNPQTNSHREMNIFSPTSM